MKLYHPHTGQEIEVDDNKVDDWTEMGWRKTKPDIKPEAEAPAADNRKVTK